MEETYTPPPDPVPPPSTTPSNLYHHPPPPQPIPPPPPPANYDPDAARNRKKKILIVGFVWRIFLWVLMVIFFILGYRGFERETLYPDYKCNQVNHRPETGGLEILLFFWLPAISLVILETINLLAAACLHFYDKCACLWTLDAVAQVVLAGLSAWAGGGLIIIAMSRLRDGRLYYAKTCDYTGWTSPTPKPPPASDDQLKEELGYNFLLSGGVIGSLCGLFLMLTIAVIVFSKPDPKAQQVIMYPSPIQYPLQQQQPMAAPAYYAAPAPQTQ